MSKRNRAQREFKENMREIFVEAAKAGKQIADRTEVISALSNLIDNGIINKNDNLNIKVINPKTGTAEELDKETVKQILDQATHKEYDDMECMFEDGKDIDMISKGRVFIPTDSYQSNDETSSLAESILHEIYGI